MTLTWISVAAMTGESASTFQAIVFSVPVGMPPNSWIAGPGSVCPPAA